MFHWPEQNSHFKNERSNVEYFAHKIRWRQKHGAHTLDSVSSENLHDRIICVVQVFHTILARKHCKQLFWNYLETVHSRAPYNNGNVRRNLFCFWFGILFGWIFRQLKSITAVVFFLTRLSGWSRLQILRIFHNGNKNKISTSAVQHTNKHRTLILHRFIYKRCRKH